jgi:hypothetical protein
VYKNPYYEFRTPRTTTINELLLKM